MWAAVSSPVGGSNVPAAIETRSPEAGSQNRLDPQISQNPRRAVADDRYQRSPSDSIRTSASGRVAVNAAKCPLVRRHIVQWQSTTGRSGPRTPYRTAPQRQPPDRPFEDESSSRVILPPQPQYSPTELFSASQLPRDPRGRPRPLAYLQVRKRLLQRPCDEL